MQNPDKDLMKDPPQKVALMYQSVIEMINEGADINTIKVADITTRAGIGKGTAYEYFSSKEEIIVESLLYEMMKSMEYMQEVANNTDSFEVKIKSLLDYGAKHYHEGRTFFQMLKILFGSYDVSESLKQQFCMMKEENICNQFLALQDIVMLAGVREKVLKEGDIVQQRVVFSSQIVAFLMYLNEIQKKETDMTLEEVKQFVYDNIVKLLG